MTAVTLDAPPVRAASDYGRLLAQVQRAGLVRRHPWRYLPRFVVLGVLTGVGLAGLLWLGDSWWQLAVGVYFAVVFAQLAFLGHDAGHQQIFAARKWNDRVGLMVSNLFVGLSYRWWVDKHNRHHRNPNEVGRDPDVQRNVLAWTDDQARSQRGLLRLVARHQDLFFFPLLLLEGWNLHVGSVRTLLRPSRGRRIEVCLLSVHVVGSVALLLTVLSPLKVLVFILLQKSVFGLYLGATFAPNHKGMQIVEDANRPDFLRRQVLTSRNIVGGRVTSTIFGGLNYQIEHHLFPSMPSHCLRRCRPLVKDFCAANGVVYTEMTAFASYRKVLSYLHSIRPDRERR